MLIKTPSWSDRLHGAWLGLWGGLVRGGGDVPMARAFGSFNYGRTQGLERPYKEHAWVYACITEIAQNISQVPFRIYMGSEDTPRLVEETNPLVQLFDRPNDLPTMSRYQFFEAILTYLETRGACVIAMPGRTNITEFPRAMYPADPADWECDTDKKTGWPVGWFQTHNPQNRKIPYALHQVLYLRYFNPYDPIAGLAPLDAARLGVEQDFHAGTYNRAFFKHGSFPGGILVINDTLGDDSYERLKQQWEERHQGPDNAFKVAILEGGAEYKQTVLSHRDMEFLEQKKWNRQEVCSVFRVPPEIIGFGKDTYQNVFQARRLFWSDTLVRKMRFVQDYFWGSFFQFTLGGKYWGMFDTTKVEALQEDFKGKVDTGYKLWQMGYPINEINSRVQLGLPNVAWGNVGWAPINLVPIGDDPSKDNTVDQNADEPKALAHPLEPKALAAGESRGITWEAYVRALTPLERVCQTKIKRFFFRQRKLILAQFYKLAGPTGAGRAGRKFEIVDLEALLQSFIDEDRQLLAVMRPLFGTAVINGATMIYEELGLEPTFEAELPMVIQFLERKELKVVGINKTLSAQLRATLVAGLEKGETTEVLADRIRSTYNFAQSRSLAIARTEMASSLSGGRFLAMEQAGVEGSRWVTAADELVRATHRVCHMVIRLLGDRFPNGLLFPGDPAGPAREVIHCFLPGTVVSGNVIAGSKVWYAGSVREIQTAWGHRLSVTPNHPVLTTRGWVTAGELREGDYLLSYQGELRPGVLRNVHDEQSPALIEDVFQALAIQGAIRLTMVRSLDFHGDGARMDSEIHVVGTDSVLRNYSKSDALDRLGKTAFVEADAMGKAGQRHRPFTAGVKSIGPATTGSPRRSALALDRRAIVLDSLPFQSFRFGPAANWDVVLSENLADRAATYSQFSRELLQASAGLVALDQVVKVRKFDYAGHVLDLQSPCGWIIAQGVVSSNCRCFPQPIPKVDTTGDEPAEATE